MRSASISSAVSQRSEASSNQYAVWSLRVNALLLPPSCGRHAVDLALPEARAMPLNIMCSRKCDTPASRSRSLRAPTWYQSITATTGSTWRSTIRTRRPFARRSSLIAAPPLDPLRSAARPRGALRWPALAACLGGAPRRRAGARRAPSLSGQGFRLAPRRAGGAVAGAESRPARPPGPARSADGPGGSARRPPRARRAPRRPGRDLLAQERAPLADLQPRSESLPMRARRSDRTSKPTARTRAGSRGSCPRARVTESIEYCACAPTRTRIGLVLPSARCTPRIASRARPVDPAAHLARYVLGTS